MVTPAVGGRYSSKEKYTPQQAMQRHAAVAVRNVAERTTINS
jgi:hypothetical protein